MSDEILNRLKLFITEQGFGYTLPWPLLFKKREIKRETTLEGDLKIYGDDSDEFFMSFGKEYNVDVSQFPIGDYFSNEGSHLLLWLIGKPKRKIKQLTIGHLEKAIIAGRLDEEIINEKKL
jgi:hypothetical protein